MIGMAVFLGCTAALAVDGISVTAHWTGQNLNTHGGYGQIWRHDIVDSKVVRHARLYLNPGRPARNPVLSPDGSHVAFLLLDGAIAVMSVKGGEAAVFSAVQSHGEATLDWPSGQWIYYTQGGHNQPSGSKYLRRVHALTGFDEAVTTFRSDDGVTEHGTWRFHVASDLRRAVVRADNNPPEPYGRITATDLVGDAGRLREARSVPRFSCATGIDPLGEFFLAGHEDHEGIDVRRWDDLSITKSIRWADAVSYGPDTRDTGLSHNRNAWSTNSSKWLCIHAGWGNRGDVGANQMLIDWQDHERIVVTDNTEGSMSFDDAGDFWVAYQAPLPDLAPPTVLSAVAHANPRQVIVMFSEPVEPRSAEDPHNYAIDNGVIVESARLDPTGYIVRLTTSALREGVGYGLSIFDVTDLAVPANAVAEGSYLEFSYSKRQPLVVNAGGDLKGIVGMDVLLTGTVTCEKIAKADIRWSLVQGPGQAAFESPTSPLGFVQFDAVGTYTLRLWADDGQTEAFDDVLATVDPEPSITVLSPAPGSVLVAGSTVDVQWLAQSVYDVRIDLSVDGGASWELQALTIDTASAHWRNFPWVVPDVSSEAALLELEEYSAVTSTVSSPFRIEAAAIPLAELTFPTAQDLMEAGKPTRIAFSPRGNGTVDLQYSLNNGASWHAVAHAVEVRAGEPKEVAWTAPLASSQFCQVRLVDSESKALVGVSAVFTIAPSGELEDAVVPLSVSIHVCSPRAAARLTSWRANATDVAEDSKCVSAEVSIPQNVASAVFEVQGHDGARVYRRLIEVDVPSLP
jgi:hypothetical protein